MNHVNISLGNADLFDTILAACRAQGIAEHGDLQIITKPFCTTNGQSGALLTFTANIGGRPIRVQTTTTVGILVGVLKALEPIAAAEGTMIGVPPAPAAGVEMDNVTLTCGPGPADTLKITREGVTFMGRKIDDAGEVHRLFLSVLNRMMVVDEGAVQRKARLCEQLDSDARAMVSMGWSRATIDAAIAELQGANSRPLVPEGSPLKR